GRARRSEISSPLRHPVRRADRARHHRRSSRPSERSAPVPPRAVRACASCVSALPITMPITVRQMLAYIVRQTYTVMDARAFQNTISVDGGGDGQTVGDMKLAEREGFEPPIRLPVCRISSAVLSTTQPPLRGRRRRNHPVGRRLCIQRETAKQERRPPC